MSVAAVNSRRRRIRGTARRGAHRLSRHVEQLLEHLELPLQRHAVHGAASRSVDAVHDSRLVGREQHRTRYRHSRGCTLDKGLRVVRRRAKLVDGGRARARVPREQGERAAQGVAAPVGHARHEHRVRRPHAANLLALGDGGADIAEERPHAQLVAAVADADALQARRAEQPVEVAEQRRSHRQPSHCLAHAVGRLARALDAQ
mmetsp:Transcript_37313/g.109346  ORF Transcript_37313/g.109346 Transcript_37313/m.109346 type:complete len:203 (-) Transcript_37313:103-711(-)